MAKILRNIDQIIDTQGNELSVANPVEVPQQLESFRNRIINGDMKIDQRNAGAAITSGYPVDRFNTYSAGITNWQAQQISEGPAGFSNSVKYTCTPAIETPDATDYLNFVQRIEGFNFYDFNYGTTDAKSFTLSFYLKTNLAGTYGISFHNNAFNRVYVATYTVSASDAAAENWVRYSILVPGDTSSSTWEVGNLVGITIEFCLSIGSDRDGTTGTWSSTSSVFGAIGQVNLLSSTSNYWQITGVQLEEGTVATPFEHRPIGTELALCHRYYQKSYDLSEKPGGSVTYPTNGPYLGSYRGSEFVYSLYNSTYLQRLSTNIPLKTRMRSATGQTIKIYNPYNGDLNNVMQAGGGISYATSLIAYSETSPSFYATVTGNSYGNSGGDIFRYHWVVENEL
jgi:hypothetical protein